MAIALATTSGLAVREVVSVDVGGTAHAAGYCIEYVGSFEEAQRHRTVSGVVVNLLDRSCTDVQATLRPSVNTYPGASQPIGTPDVWISFSEDVYVGIAGGGADRILLNIFVFPFQWLLWFGGIVVVAGGSIAYWRKPSRRREASEQVTTADKEPSDE
jgi:cytochrome c biogenesis factor